MFGVNEGEFGALAMNLTIIDPAAAPGFVAVKPTQAAPLSSLVNWYEVGPTVQAANQAIVAMDHSGAIPEFTIQTSALVHVIVDIFGAFLVPEKTALDNFNVTTGWSLFGGNNTFDVLATCPAGYSITGGGWNTNGSPGRVIPQQSSRAGATQGWRCRGYASIAALLESGYCEAICARTPGR